MIYNKGDIVKFYDEFELGECLVIERLIRIEGYDAYRVRELDGHELWVTSATIFVEPNIDLLAEL